MDLDKIIAELNRQFQEPLKEFYSRHIIFWHDEEGEFRDQMDNFSLENAKVLILTETNNFYAKKLLTYDDTDSNYLIYDPFPRGFNEDNWLLDIELYSREFRADLISIWMQDMALPSNGAIRQQVREYKKFFNAASRRHKIATLPRTPQTGAELHMAMMQIICGCSEGRTSVIVRSVLKAGLDEETNTIYKSLVSYGEDKMFWYMVERALGYASATPTLQQLAAHVILTAATRTMQVDYLNGLQGFISMPHQALCYDLVSDWIHSDDKESYRALVQRVEAEANLIARFRTLPMEDLLATEVFPCINDVILVHIMEDIADDIVKVQMIREAVEKRRICSWYDDTAIYFDGLFQLANMQDFYLENDKESDDENLSFHATSPQKLWNDYVDKYYLMDTYYRKFHVCFDKSRKCYNEKLDDLWYKVKDKAERLYVNWYLEKLGENWSKVSADEYEHNGHIEGVPRQTDFYGARVKRTKPSDGRIFVVISDAFRYELAASLVQELQQENICTAKLSAMQSVFPSYTKYGMAALLPHRELTVKVGTDDMIDVLADGEPTVSSNRDKILKKANPSSLAVQAEKLMKMPRAERKELVKGMQIVYIYHNVVDAAGHEEKSVFAACDEAIEEIKNLIRIMVNDFSAANILITADHGFLYTYDPLQESDKISMVGFKGKEIECARRYVIAEKGTTLEHMQPIMIMEGRTEYMAFSPKENIRLKVKGAGMNFVHGGASLQEMVVPVLEYHNLRNDSKEYQKNRDQYDTKPVEVKILSATRKISNMIFNLEFYQAEPVGNNRKAATCQLYFVDTMGKLVSDVQKIIADKTDADNQQRKFRCIFNLKSQKFDNMKAYYLVAVDENNVELFRAEYKIDIPFALEDFGFFS